jgi:hypothetical protein
MLVHAVDQTGAPPLKMPDRFVTEIAYFATPAGERGAPATLAEKHYWIVREDAERWLNDGVLALVSPLDSLRRSDVELREEHEDFLTWVIENDVHHVRLD